MKVLLSVSVLAFTLATAITKIPKDCLIRGDSWGDDKVKNLVDFDQTDWVLNYLTLGQKPYKILYCVDNRDEIANFKIIFKNEEGTQTATLPQVGPEDDECKQVTFPNREHFKSIRLFQDGYGIKAIQIMQHGDFAELVTYGKFERKDEDKVFSFTEENPVVGFYGQAGKYHLKTLGFLTKD